VITVLLFFLLSFCFKNKQVDLINIIYQFENKINQPKKPQLYKGLIQKEI
jgi:hypothetical protein